MKNIATKYHWSTSVLWQKIVASIPQLIPFSISLNLKYNTNIVPQEIHVNKYTYLPLSADESKAQHCSPRNTCKEIHSAPPGKECNLWLPAPLSPRSPV